MSSWEPVGLVGVDRADDDESKLRRRLLQTPGGVEDLAVALFRDEPSDDPAHDRAVIGAPLTTEVDAGRR
jgi:hypothetical protein